MDETKITAKLPNLDVEITRRELPEHDAETITLHMTAVPSFEAFAGYLNKQGNLPLSPFGAAWMMSPWANPWANLMQSWTQLAQLAWMPWIEATTPRLTGPRDDEGVSQDK